MSLTIFCFLPILELSAKKIYKLLLIFASNLGVPLAPGKTVAPFLAVLMEARLPEDKLKKGKMLLVAFQRKYKVTLRVGVLKLWSTVLRWSTGWLEVAKGQHNVHLYF